jgi:hypothetical protein
MRSVLSALALAALASTAATPALAQSNVSGIRLGGLGRAIVTNDYLSGDAIRGDSTNGRRSAGGYTLVDLAVEATPNPATEARVVLRLRNELGGFFGDGYRFGIRELYVRGTIADAVDYTVGDMDLKLTPYTLYSTPETTGNEAEVFALRRDVTRYENFDYGEDTWRLQGLRSGVGLAFGDVATERRARVQGFVARTAPTSGNVPERIIGGGRVEADLNRGIGAGVTFVDLFDLEETGANQGLSNPVLTGDLRVAYALPASVLEGATVGLRAEGGGSRAGFGDGSTVPTREDFFVAGGVFAAYRGVALAAGYRDVGPRFISPGAQTRRLAYGQAPNLFATADGFAAAGLERELTQFDAIAQENLYTNRIQPVLLPYDPRLDPAEPYGRATPNRRGLSLELGYGEPRSGNFGATENPESGPVAATAGLDLLEEVVGEGTPETRRFTVASGALDLSLADYVGRPFVVTLGVKHMQTDRDAAPFPTGAGDAVADSGAVDLTSTLFNAGVTANLTGRLDALVGVKVLTASGNELRASRDDSSDPFAVTGFQPLVYDDTQALYGLGLRYRVRERNYLLVQGSLLGVRDDRGAAASYQIADLFLHYVLTF